MIVAEAFYSSLSPYFPCSFSLFPFFLLSNIIYHPRLKRERGKKRPRRPLNCRGLGAGGEWFFWGGEGRESCSCPPRGLGGKGGFFWGG